MWQSTLEVVEELDVEDEDCRSLRAVRVTSSLSGLSSPFLGTMIVLQSEPTDEKEEEDVPAGNEQLNVRLPAL